MYIIPIIYAKGGNIMSLKDSWKATGTGLGHAFRDLGKTIVKSASTAVNKADEWANDDEKQEEKKENEE